LASNYIARYIVHSSILFNMIQRMFLIV